MPNSQHLPSPTDALRRIVLTGFMGSGKTTVGRVLAERLRWRFADLDNSIEELLGIPVPQIFAEQGEMAFRAAELDALRKLLLESRIVVALGGGAVEAPGLRDLLAGSPETAVVYLEGDFDVFHERCVEQARDPRATPRPLFGTAETARGRFEHREPLYQSMATHTVASHPNAPEAVAEGILQALR